MQFAEKLRLLRKAHNMTQADFARTLGISRGNLANIERGSVSPTPVLINCISLMYHIDKEWLLDDNNDDITAMNNSVNMQAVIASKYEQLNDNYKNFVVNQIKELLELQNKEAFKNNR